MSSTSGVYGSIPTVDTTSTKYAQTTQDADQLRVDFLKLLTAQLQYQDPMKPVENTEFTSQMAQFTGLNEQQKSNQLLEQLVKSQNVGQMNQAVSYIGKVAVVEGNNMTMASGEGKLRFDMPQTGAVTINLLDETGQVVKTIPAQTFDSGSQSYTVRDTAIPNGNYQFSVTRQDSEGNSVAVSTLESGVVKAVINDTSGVILEMNGRRVNLADVRQVEQG
ncbi:MAG: hypothetical protein HQL98_03790 [Magnetococcales bacterium]|nr:hypothetical protein [Magnetococcales bacterium]